MKLKIDQWYLHPSNGWADPYSLVKITGFRFNTVEFENHNGDDGEMTVPQFTRTYTSEVTLRVNGWELANHPTYSDYYTLDLCQHCYVMLVNGDPCDCGDDTEQHPDGLMGKLEGDEVTPGTFASEHDSRCLTYLLDSADVPGGYECECEHDTHSTVSCDGCGTYLHGKRYRATGWIRKA